MKKKLISSLIVVISTAALLMGCSQKVERVSRDAGDTAGGAEQAVEQSDEPQTYPFGYGPSHYYSVYKVNGFKTTDTEGNVVDDGIFKNADYTMINVWGTYCGPCINEMADLQALSESMPDNMQIIGIVCDVYDGEDSSSATKILDSKGVTYTNLLCNDELMQALSGLSAVPTTLFVNRDGYVLCNPIIGADLKSYKAVIKDLGEANE